MTIFYAPDIAATHELPEEESGHAVRVLRMHEGDEVMVVDGNGSFYSSVITCAHPKHCTIEIQEESAELQRPYSVEIAVAPTKNLDRMEWFIEKATEMGLDRFTPLKCRFSERKELKSERMVRIAVSAMKQSLKASLPQIDEMTNIKDYILEPFDGLKFIAHCYKDSERLMFSQAVKPNQKVRMLIGPEGDFSEEEVKLALDNGFIPVTLGRYRLRTETAALAACHTIHVINELENADVRY